jgi:glycosyltransferase involved in cell wall biosynthesis
MITILIPLYNGIEYLPETINSVISQTYTDWRMLIGINGHGDNGGEVALQVEQLVKSEPRIQVIIQPVDINNKPKSLNNLVSFVKTEWVAILDADDLWLPTKLEEQISIICSCCLDGIILTQ